MKKNIIAKVAGTVASAALAVSLCACGGAPASEAPAAQPDGQASYELVTDGKLTVVAELGFAPFEYIDADGNTVGFDVDLANAIAEHMGLECEYLPNQSFDTLVPTIAQGGRADISIAAITIDDTRREQVDFSDPYLDSNQALVAADSFEGEAESLDAAGVKVACQGGTTGEAWIKEHLPNATVVPLADVTAGMAGVQTGLYDAMVVDLPVASNMIASSFSDLKVVKKIPTGEQYGIAVSYDNPALRDAINEALAQIESDGTMAQLKAKWFGEQI